MIAYASENVLQQINIDPADAKKIRDTLETNGMLAASKQVSMEMVRPVMAYGKGEQIRERIEEYVSYGLGLPILLPLPPNFRESVEIGGRYARAR